MTPTFFEQFKMIIYFVIFGMFLTILYEILNFYILKWKYKIYINLLLETLFWIILIVIACIFMIRVSKGYIPLYTFVFYLLGVAIYQIFIRKSFLKDLVFFDRVLTKFIKFFGKILKEIFFPIEVYNLIKKVLKATFLKVRRIFVQVIKFKSKKRNPEAEIK